LPLHVPLSSVRPPFNTTLLTMLAHLTALTSLGPVKAAPLQGATLLPAVGSHFAALATAFGPLLATALNLKLC